MTRLSPAPSVSFNGVLVRFFALKYRLNGAVTRHYLAEAGLVIGSDSPTGGRRRTVYEITADGEEELRAWLRQPPHTFEMREEGLLKLFFANVLPAEEAVPILRAMRAHRLAAAAQLRAMEPMAREKEDPFPLIVLQGGIEFTEWFADWCERMEQRLLGDAPDERN